MKKIPVPKKQELIEFFMEELEERNIHLVGDVNGFSRTLYKSFRQFIKENYTSYEEAEIACLRKLIEIVKNK